MRSSSALRPLASVVGLVAAAFLVAGGTAWPCSDSPSSPVPSAGNIDDQHDMERALLDVGRMLAVAVGALPESVDPKTDITLSVTYGDLTDDVDLDGDPDATGAPDQRDAALRVVDGAA